MPKQLKIAGFDTKCEFCGNFYGADYIEFHKKHRCLRNPFKVKLLSPETNTHSQKQTIDFAPRKKLTNQENALQSKLPTVVFTKTELTKKANKSLRCPHCAVSISPQKYQSHIDKRCPARHQRKKKEPFTKKSKNKLSRKKQLLNFPEPVRAFIPVENNRIRCFKCKTIYSKTDTQCPECQRLELRNKSLIKCSICEKPFEGKVNFDNHILRCNSNNVSCLICKEALTIEKFNSHQHDLIKSGYSVIRKSITTCEFCNCNVNSNKYNKHLLLACGKIELSCFTCKIVLFRSNLKHHLLAEHKIDFQIASKSNDMPSLNNLSKSDKSANKKSKSGFFVKALALKKTSFPRRCRICGRPTMYNSGHCYSCGDK